MYYQMSIKECETTTNFLIMNSIAKHGINLFEVRIDNDPFINFISCPYCNHISNQ